MKLRGWKLALAALVILAALALLVNVSSHTVQAAPAPGQIFIDLDGNYTYDPGTETLYPNIQDAIDSATIGQTVVVGAGTYTEQLSIDKNISLVGASMANTSISCPATLITEPSMVLVSGGATVNLTGFSLTGPGSALGMGLYVFGDSYVHVWNCTFSDIRHNPIDSSQSPICIKLGNATSLSVGAGLIEECVFSDWQKVAIRVDSAGSYAEVRNCTIHGWSTTSSLVVQIGIHVVDHANAWIHDNTIDQIGGTNGGWGIMLENGANALIEKNDLTGINTVGDLSKGILLFNSGTSVIIQNNTLTHWAWGAYVWDTVQGPLFESNTFDSNRGSGIELDGAQNTSMLFNDFIQNGLPTGGNGLIITAGSTNSSAHYNNFLGNHVGLYAAANVPFNATLNYWGSFSGPSDSGWGTGDAIHEASGHPVAWSPWLKSPYPLLTPISGIGGKGVVDQSTPLDLSATAGISVQLNGSGSPLVTAFRYSQGPTDPFAGKSLERYIDVRISSSTGVTQLTVTLHYNQTDVPAGMNESELRLYWWNGTQWTAVSDCTVDPVANLIIAEFRTDTQPALGQLVGTPFLGGTPKITLSPLSGPSGTLITVEGNGFLPFSMVTMKFADNLVAVSQASWLGTVTIEGLAPYAQPGAYKVSLVDSWGCTGSSSFSVVDGSALDIQVSVGSLHFRGELATFWASTSLNGMPVDVDSFTAVIYNPDMGVLNLTAVRVATGLYCMNYTIPLNAGFGDYAFVATAVYGSHWGVGLTGGQISQTLTGFNAQLIGIEANIATIQTDLGVIQMNLSQMNLELVSLNGRVAVLETDVGSIRVDLATIAANVTSINGSVAAIQTDLGLLMVNVSAIDAHLISIDSDLISIDGQLDLINGALATVQISLGIMQVDITSIQVSLVEINGTLATMETSLGRVDVNVTAVNAHLVSIDGTLATVQTSLGTVQTSLDDIDARIISLQGTVARINTTCGALTVSLAALDLKVVQVQGSLVTIQTTLGTMDGQIIALQGTTATIQTDLGTVSADVKEAQNNSNNNSTTIIVLLILILVVLIGMYFWKLRKVL